MEIVIATNNNHKVEEFRKIFPSITFYSLKDLGINVEIEENGKTFQDNSFIKAKEIVKYTNKIILADDSGLVVNALPNILGVASHRFLGEDVPYVTKANKLIEMLENKDRSAYFECVITILNLKKEPLFFKGICKGSIATKLSGTNGFGYDICFIPDGYDTTFASLPENVKNSISHRAMASKELYKYLKSEGLL